jgi:hypothetical protein
MAYAIGGGEFRDTATSMLINTLIFHVNSCRIDLRTPQGAARPLGHGDYGPSSQVTGLPDWPSSQLRCTEIIALR